MAYRRRGFRRRRTLWLPGNVRSLTYNDQAPSLFSGGISGIQSHTSGSEPLLAVYAINPADAPRENLLVAGPTSSMADIGRSSYLLRRIVGNLHLHVEGEPDEPVTGGYPMHIAAGFFIARADSTGVAPVGWGQSTIDDWNNYSPLSAATQREPWIWRRNWILAPTLQATGGLSFGSCPEDNSTLTVRNGPHIDAKTMRRIGDDDRLFFALTAIEWYVWYGITGNAFDEGFTRVSWNLDYRLLGSMRSDKPGGKF